MLEVYIKNNNITLVSLHFKTPVSRGRGQEPRKCLSFSAPADLGQSLSFSEPHANSLPVTTASSPAKNTPAETTTTRSTKSTTLFNAVASRAANVTFSPNMFTGHHLKADIPKTTTSALSSSSNSPFATMAPCKVKSTSSSGANITISPKVTKNFTAVPKVSQAKRPASIPLTLMTTTFDSDVLKCSDTNPKTTASDTTAPSILTAPETNDFSMPSKTDGAAPAYDGLAFAAIYTPEKSYKSARKSTAALEKTKTTRHKPGNAHIQYLR